MLRFGLVGCGQIAQAHAAALRFLEADGVARLVALADPDADAIARVARIVGNDAVHRTEPRDVIGDSDVDALVIAAPTRFHRDLIAAAAAAGKPIFTEKPLAPDFDTAVEIVTTVNDSRIAAQVGFQSRFHPIIRFVHEAVGDLRYGAPMAYVLRYDQFWPTGGVVAGHTSWRSQATEAGGGALLEHSIHSCDIACWLFGPPLRVYARARNVFGYDVEDAIALTIEHESGVIGTLVSIFNGVKDREERRLEVFFERGVIEATTDFLVGAPEDGLLTKSEEGAAEIVDCQALRRATFLRDGVDPDREFYVYQYLAHRAFANAVATGTPPKPNCDDALTAHALVEAAYRSVRSGGPVAIAELGAFGGGRENLTNH